MALLAVQVHSNGQRQIRQVVVRSVGGCVKDVDEGDPAPLVLVVLSMARQPYTNMTGWSALRSTKAVFPLKINHVPWVATSLHAVQDKHQVHTKVQAFLGTAKK